VITGTRRRGRLLLVVLAVIGLLAGVAEGMGAFSQQRTLVLVAQWTNTPGGVEIDAAANGIKLDPTDPSYTTGTPLDAATGFRRITVTAAFAHIIVGNVIPAIRIDSRVRCAVFDPQIKAPLFSDTVTGRTGAQATCYYNETVRPTPAPPTPTR